MTNGAKIIEIITADITKLEVDAMSMPPTVRFWAAGRDLLEACRKFNGCETGEVRITVYFYAHYPKNLPAAIRRSPRHC